MRTKGTLYKITGPKGEALNGGDWTYALPKSGKPGKWQHHEGGVLACSSGFHLTSRDFAECWLSEGCRMWEAEYYSDFDDDLDDSRFYSKGKIAVRHVRLVKEIPLPAWFGEMIAFFKTLKNAPILSFTGALGDGWIESLPAHFSYIQPVHHLQTYQRLNTFDRFVKSRLEVVANLVLDVCRDITYNLDGTYEYAVTEAFLLDIRRFCTFNIAFTNGTAIAYDEQIDKQKFAELQADLALRASVWLSGYVPVCVNNGQPVVLTHNRLEGN